jgi:peptidoglycan/xylan/chitin deacetylase (PgdA/CDA1 family)
MRSGLVARLRRGFEKNADEWLALASGRMPGFVAGRGTRELAGETPVFCFHEVEPERFERQLRHLQQNGYPTVDAEELEALLANPGAARGQVALSFDDATASFWTYAFPLLRHYGCRAILFAIPGLVPDDATRYPNLEDLWRGRATLEQLAERARVQPLCTWRELRAMQASGVVDVQSHSMTHSRVATSPRLVDFYHPGYPIESYGAVNVPISALHDPQRAECWPWPGAPIFESAPRMAGRPRFLEPRALDEALAAHVAVRGGARFFACEGWRRELEAIAAQFNPRRRGRFESEAETRRALAWELSESKRRIEERLPGKRVTHFCYPWYEGSAQTDQLAGEAGYRAVHYGLRLPRGRATGASAPLRVRRVSEDYLLRLPGEGRLPLRAIWRERYSASLARLRAAR